MGTRSIALFDALSKDVSEFIGDGPVGLTDIPPDVSYKRFVASRILESVLKKYPPVETSAQDEVARQKFLTSNKKCRDWRLHLDGELAQSLFGLLRDEIDKFCHPDGQTLVSSYYDLLAEGRTGPGSAIGARSGSLYGKLFSSKLTTTSPELYELYSDFFEWYPRWHEADRLRRDVWGNYEVVKCSRSSFVPKTDRESRMICVEPSLNMFFQLGFGALLEGRLRSIGIDLSTQPLVNRRLARQGSIDESFSTIDLSSASDSLSLGLLEALFPNWFFELVLRIRSPKTSFGECVVPLNMISTMGNGFTFPLQTVIFSSVIRACYRYAGLPLRNGRRANWSCFGDDLICHRDVYENVCLLLNLIGCTVNADKSFNKGPFRESCGTDWLRGQPVRGIYVKSLKSRQDIFVAINLLNLWSAYSGIYLPGSVDLLLSWVPNWISNLVPLEENADAGLRVPSTIFRSLAARYDENGSPVYRAYRSRPFSFRVMNGVIKGPRGCKKLSSNHPGLEISFLYGELNSFKISVRHDVVIYKEKLLCSPRWDYIPKEISLNGYSPDWRQWETAVRINLRNP